MEQFIAIEYGGHVQVKNEDGEIVPHRKALHRERMLRNGTSDAEDEIIYDVLSREVDRKRHEGDIAGAYALEVIRERFAP